MNNENIKSFTLPKFLHWREAVERLRQVESGIKRVLQKQPQWEFLPAYGFLAAVQGAVVTLSSLNDDLLCSPVAWDEELGIESLPSLQADAGHAASYLEENDFLRAFFSSFRGWSLLFSQTKECACGSYGMSMRAVRYGLFLEHHFAGKDGKILATQRVGVKSDDDGHLKKHYADRKTKGGEIFYNPSKVLPNTNIIWTCQNMVELKPDDATPKIEFTGLEAAREFYPEEREFAFGKFFMEVINFIDS